MRNLIAVFLFLMILTAPAFSQEQGSKAQCLGCHGDPNLATTRNGRRVSLYVNSKRYDRSMHGSLSCSSCHIGDPHAPGIPPEVKGTELGKLATKLNRPHSVALLACMNCHTEEFAQYRDSIHGTSSLSGQKATPVCSSCHGTHYISTIMAPESQVRPQNVPATCGSCHSNQRLMAEFNINTHTVETFSQSFHGRRLALGSRRVADCSSCHGFHAIYPPSDPRSSVYPANRPKTCGKPGCHPGAGPRFAAGFAHRIPSPKVEPASYWLSVLYRTMILGVAGFMLLWVLADLFRRFRRWGWHWKSKHREPLPVAPETPIQRWDIHQRIQHLMLLGSFVMLVLTGLPMLFPLSPVSRLLVGIAGGPETAGVIHRIMASILLLGAAYHVIYLFVRLMRRKLGTSIIPRHKDMMDAYHYTRYYAGLEKDPPRAGRYTFDEKVEYWSMIWGTIVMALTGSVLWFPLGPARILGVWVVDLSRVIHGYEALLAAISIIIWHLYHAHLNPDVFPMSRVWLTGKLTAAEEAHHHPLEFDQLVREGKLKPKSTKKRQPPPK